MVNCRQAGLARLCVSRPEKGFSIGTKANETGGSWRIFQPWLCIFSQVLLTIKSPCADPRMLWRGHTGRADCPIRQSCLCVGAALGSWVLPVSCADEPRTRACRPATKVGPSCVRIVRKTGASADAEEIRWWSARSKDTIFPSTSSTRRAWRYKTGSARVRPRKGIS